MITRREDWPQRLNQYIEGCRYRQFDWGVHDCGTLVTDVFEQVTGIVVRDVAHPRKNVQDFFRYLIKDPDGLTGLATKTFGFSPQTDNWRMARRGDIVIVESPRIQMVGVRQAMAVALGSDVATVGLLGLEFLALSSVVRVWRVGP